MLDDMENMKESERQALFQNAVNKRLYIQHGYFNAAVLVIRWHEGIDEGHDEEIRKLKKLFCDGFHYEYEEIQLDTSKKPQYSLNNAITQFILKHVGPNNLLILYYIGHGSLQYPTDGPGLILTGPEPQSKNGRYPAMALWDDAEKPLLQQTEADVLVILDCCFASNAQKNYIASNAQKKYIWGRRTYELLATSPTGQTTRGPSPLSFTTALIKSLEALLAEYQNRSFTSTKLMDKLNRNRNPPCMLWDRLHKFERHIQLAPLPKRPSEGEEKLYQCREPEQAWVKLRFSLKVSELSRKQIEDLAYHLPTAYKSAGIPVRQIDWIKMESASTPPSSSEPRLKPLFTAATAVSRMRRKSHGPSRPSPFSHSEGSRSFKRQRTTDASPTMKRPSLFVSAQPQGEADPNSPAVVSPISVVISESPSD